MLLDIGQPGTPSRFLVMKILSVNPVSYIQIRCRLSKRAGIILQFTVTYTVHHLKAQETDYPLHPPTGLQFWFAINLSKNEQFYPPSLAKATNQNNKISFVKYL